MATKIKVLGELESATVSGKLADAGQIKDANQGGKSQAQINAEIIATGLNNNVKRGDLGDSFVLASDDTVELEWHTLTVSIGRASSPDDSIALEDLTTNQRVGRYFKSIDGEEFFYVPTPISKTLTGDGYLCVEVSVWDGAREALIKCVKVNGIPYFASNAAGYSGSAKFWIDEESVAGTYILEIIADSAY